MLEKPKVKKVNYGKATRYSFAKVDEKAPLPYLLQIQKDPYKIDDFFPCADLTWVREAGIMLPVAEVFLYKKKLDHFLLKLLSCLHQFL